MWQAYFLVALQSVGVYSFVCQPKTPKRPKVPTLDTHRLLRHFGSVSDLRLALELNELPVPKAGTVRQWYARKSIPCDWLATLIVLSERIGDPIWLPEFIRV